MWALRMWEDIRVYIRTASEPIKVYVLDLSVVARGLWSVTWHLAQPFLSRSRTKIWHTYLARGVA